MKKTLYTEINFDYALAEAESSTKLWEVCADLLSISIEEFCDFMVNWDFDPITCESVEELESTYVEYCAEYDIPCLQIGYDCYDKLGW